LCLQEPGRGLRRDSHPVANKQDHVLGRMDQLADVQRLVQLILGALRPVNAIYDIVLSGPIYGDPWMVVGPLLVRVIRQICILSLARK